MLSGLYITSEFPEELVVPGASDEDPLSVDDPEPPMIPPRPLPSMIDPELRSPTMSFPVSAEIRPIASAIASTAQSTEISIFIKNHSNLFCYKKQTLQKSAGSALKITRNMILRSRRS